MTTINGNYAAVNGVRLYYEIHGQGEPLVLLHGGLNNVELLGNTLTQLAATRQVIAVDLQGHGRTADIDRPLRYAYMADDIAALIRHLGLAHVDVMGYSLGGGTALRTAIQHPDLVRKLVLVSVTFQHSGSYPEVVAGMEQMSGAAAEFMKGSPLYRSYAQVAPHPDSFPQLLDKLGDLLRQPYDWSAAVAALPMPVLLIFADADSVTIDHMMTFYKLLGGGQRDANWDGAYKPVNKLAVLPDCTHYDIFASPLLPVVAETFLTNEH
ncbi:MAG: alpha/beta hydrolase [Caldilineaceae bacterium]|nr:alpha/beta hydrolase [Caldilineaceae bacterium]